MQHAIQNAPEVLAPSVAGPSRPGHAVATGVLADRLERERIFGTLARCCGNRTWAADILGISPLALRNKLIGYKRDAEKQERAIASREADLAAQMRETVGELRPTYVPSATFLA